MATKIIISYDGTNNEDDAIALGRVLAQAGGEPVLAYVRHSQEPELDREKLVQAQAEALLEKGAELYGGGNIGREVVESRSTPEGLSALAQRIGADVVVFCSDSHTAAGKVSIGNSARRLLEGGPVAVAIAPSGFGSSQHHIGEVAYVGDGAAAQTAQALAGATGASVVQGRSGDVDLLVVGSRPEAKQGTVALTAASENLIQEARTPVLVVPHGVTVAFGGVPVGV
jgi:nucleotide-binding universal stress UspA family protein